MSTNDRSRSLVFGIATVLALTLLAPVAVTAEEDEVVTLAPVAAPAVAGISAASVRAAAQAVAAQRALQSGTIGSLQEERLLAIVAAAPVATPTWDATSGYGAVEASRATIGYPATSTTAEQTRVLAAQQALLSPDLGSLQEEALTAVVEASSAAADASVDEAPAPTGAELLAQFRAIELALSRSLGAD